MSDHIETGGAEISFGGVRMGLFDESTAMEGITRNHASEDGMTTSGRTEKTIPFGCEYLVTRSWDAAQGILRRAVDVRALNNGVIADCALDPVTVSGNVVRAGVLADDGNCRWQDEASGNVIPRAIELEFADGTAMELASGDDLWRHRAAAELGAEAEWQYQLKNGCFKFSRTMFRFPKDAEPPKRPWRWEYHAVWGKPGTAADGDTETETIDCRNLCFAAPAEGRRLRSLVRQTTRSLKLVHAACPLCTASGHTGRPRELLHQDTGALLALYVWGSRTLAQRGLNFTVELASETAAARPGLQYRLAVPLERMENNGMA